MSAVTLASLVVAVAALGVTFAALLALTRTRRSVQELQAAVRDLAAPPTRPQQTGTHATDLLPVPYAHPTPQQVYRATMHRPLVRAVTMSYGLRRALRPESRDHIRALMRREFNRRRKIRQRAGRRATTMARMEEGS